MEWLNHNLGAVLEFVALTAAVVGGWAVNSYRIKANEEGLKMLGERLHDSELLFNTHALNTQLHIDPQRDKAIWEEFQRQMTQNFAGVVQRFDSTDRKIESIIALLPGMPRA